MYQDRREQRGNQKKCKAGRADQHKSKKGGQDGVDYGQGQTANPTDETNALMRENNRLCQQHQPCLAHSLSVRCLKGKGKGILGA